LELGTSVAGHQFKKKKKKQVKEPLDSKGACIYRLKQRQTTVLVTTWK